MRNRAELVKRYMFFFVGVWSNAVGSAIVTKSMLGAGPMTSIPYVASLGFFLSYGTFAFIFNMFLLLIQMLLLKKEFHKRQLLQIPASFIFAACIDAAMWCLGFLKVGNYATAIAFVLIGSIFRALGVACQLVADVVMLSPEAFVKAVADVTKKEFSVMKILMDALMTIIAIALSLYLFGNVQGVREGTILTVLLVGPISRLFTERLAFANHYMENRGQFVFDADLKLQDGKRLVVTITSEAGSGGRVIARILGEKLGLKVYDKELIPLVANYGGYTNEYVIRHNERLYTNFAEAFIKENYTWESEELESYRKLYESYVHVIQQLAMEQDCIIVGHCSNFILKDYQECLHVHISADMEHRVDYIKDKYGVSARKALSMIQHQDADAQQYYHHFTGGEWKDASNYHMTMDSTLFGYEETAEMVEHVVKKNYMELSSATIKEVREKYKI